MHCWCEIGVSVCLLNRLERWCISRTRHYGTTNHPLCAHIHSFCTYITTCACGCGCCFVLHVSGVQGLDIDQGTPSSYVCGPQSDGMTHNCSSQYILFPRSSQCFTTQPTSRWRRIATVAHLATTFRHAASHLQASLCFEVNPFKI